MKVAIFQVGVICSPVKRLATMCVRRLGAQVIDLGLILDTDECPRLQKGTQLDGDWLLGRLSAARPVDADVALGVTPSDVGVVGRTFVFGYAHLSDRSAVVSDARLFTFDKKVYRGRMMRVIAHELIHTVGVGHCTSKQSSCIMMAVATAENIDTIRGPCKECREKISDRKKVLGW